MILYKYSKGKEIPNTRKERFIMKMCYKAEDGKLFNTAEECVQYEKENLNLMEDAEKFLKRVKSFCELYSGNCEGCPFYKKHPTYFLCMFEGSPLEWCE